MQALITTILALIEEFLPAITGGGAATTTIVKVVTALEQIVPLIIQEASDLAPMVQNIIAAVKGSGVLTADQIAALEAQEAALDAAFDAAADAATAADQAASGTS